MSSSMATILAGTTGMPPAMEQDVSFQLENLATKLKENNHRIATPQYQQLINRVLAYAASAEQHISEQQARIRELEELSSTDELTGLSNLRGLQEFMYRILSIAQRHNETGVLAYIDLDNFKEINDARGHDAGNHVLRTFAQILKKSLRDSDFVARVGGDEFVFVLVRTSEEDGVKRTRDLQEQICSTSIKYRSKDHLLDASFGVVAFDGESDYEKLMRAADLAMYEDKRRRKLAKG